MNILEINTVNFGSTGKIMKGIAAIAREKGDHVWLCYPKYDMNQKNRVEGDILIGNRLSFYLHLKITAYLGLNGCGSVLSTFRFLREVDRLNIDAIHLHNLHNSYINLPILFRYLKRKRIPVIWTLHDCWAFTGQCPHFAVAKCAKWKKGCHHCPQTNLYPSSHVDRTRLMWKLKRKWFTGIENMTIVTPSQWLTDLVKQSYLKDYPVKVIHNGIDLSVFKPTASDFRERHGIPTDKPILLGVAFGWGERKGLDVFVKLAQDLGDAYQIVLVGTDDRIDALLPANIISIHRTQDQHELAEIYSAADVFVNPTREEVLGLVNIEANACGTPVITFKSGGSPECIDTTSGAVVECDDVEEMKLEIIRACTKRPYCAEKCRSRAEQFDANKVYQEYLNLYHCIAEQRQDAS